MVPNPNTARQAAPNLSKDIVQKTRKQLLHYRKKTGIISIILNSDYETIDGASGNWVCEHYYCRNKEECRKDHRLVIEEAYRLGNTFIHLCHRNFVLWGLPLTQDNKIIGGAISGFVLFEQNRSQLSKYLEDFPLIESSQAFLSSKSVSSYSKLLFDVFKSGKLIDVDLFKLSEEKAYIQKEIGEKLIENKQKGAFDKHIIYEKQENLMNSIKFCDIDDIRDNLNDVLSEIFLEGIANIKLLKFRMLELFVLISRTMMEVGGDIDDFYHLTTQYTKNTENLDDIYSFSIWLKEVLDDFISTLISTRKKLGQVNRAIEFIKQNLDKKLLLSEVAATVTMSESRFSCIFRQETGTSFPEYVNSVKIEKAKEMIAQGTDSLTEIAASLCFYDQSYFTKTFRKYAGLTPKQYHKKIKTTS
ncbi:helix-turn-helix domain-containing protein [bacterium]|nr:helix-turn-helix domain-containing protein [bacterium]